MKLNFDQIGNHITHILREYPIDDNRFAAKEATAIAYASLLMEDPELVTNRHIKILQKELTPQQIKEITHYVLDQVGENAYANAFRLRCSQILDETIPQIP
ncbi:MAG: hypothetical protein OER04_05805 [Cyclobacteriaceae bacterium]|nr:hypothetical protein [Cyclobacteriaceae bacterium]